MNTSRYAARMIETRYVWAPDVESCMAAAKSHCEYGRWSIEGNPAPMTWGGKHGTAVLVSRVNDE